MARFSVMGSPVRSVQPAVGRGVPCQWAGRGGGSLAHRGTRSNPRSRSRSWVGVLRGRRSPTMGTGARWSRVRVGWSSFFLSDWPRDDGALGRVDEPAHGADPPLAGLAMRAGSDSLPTFHVEAGLRVGYRHVTVRPSERLKWSSPCPCTCSRRNRDHELAGWQIGAYLAHRPRVRFGIYGPRVTEGAFGILCGLLSAPVVAHRVAVAAARCFRDLGDGVL